MTKWRFVLIIFVSQAWNIEFREPYQAEVLPELEELTHLIIALSFVRTEVYFGSFWSSTLK